MASESHTHDVLLVDDDADTREAVGFYLRSCGYQVTDASSGEAALQQLRAGAEPCVLILDARMPDMSGWELLTRLRATPEFAALPAIMVSGYREEAGLAMRLGVRAFITKPADLDAIEAAVNQHCRRTVL